VKQCEVRVNEISGAVFSFVISKKMDPVPKKSLDGLSNFYQRSCKTCNAYAE